MKKILITLCIIMLSFAMRAQEHMTFMGIPIDGKISTFTQKLEDKGFTYVKTEDWGDVFSGTFAGKRGCTINVFTLKSSTVWAVAVEFPSIPFWKFWKSAKDEYQAIKKIISSKYGEPDDDFDYDFDGYEMTSIESSSFQTCRGYITVEIVGGKAVSVMYCDEINLEIKIQEDESSISEDI